MKKRNHNVARFRKKGFSLVFVASLGALFVLIAMALGSTVLPMYNYIGSKSTNDRVLTAVESGMHYAVSALNYAASSTPPTSLGSPLAVPTNLTDGVPVTVSFSQFDPTTSPVFSNSSIIVLSPNYQNNPFYANNPTYAPIYYLLTATTGSATNPTTIQAVLSNGSNLSNLYPMNNYLNNSQVKPPNLTPFFNGALFGQSLVQLTDGVALLTEGATQQANLASNGAVVLNGNNTVDGNVTAYSQTSRNTPNIVGSPNAVINGSIDSTNAAPPSSQFQTDAPGFVPTPGFLQPNVLGNSVTGPTYGSITGSDGSLPATSAAPAQTPAATQTAAFSGTNNQTITNTIITSGANPDVINLGSVNLSGNQTLTLPPGQYIANSISITDSASLNVNVPSNASAGVTLTLTGSPPTVLPNQSDVAAAYIGGNGVNQIGSSQASGNFQIFYNGAENVDIAMSASFPTFYGLVYAPNSAVSINTGTPTANAYHGAVVGNQVFLGGFGKMYYNPNSIQPSSSGAGVLAPSYIPLTMSQAQGFTPSPSLFSVVSWQEPTKSGLQ